MHKNENTASRIIDGQAVIMTLEDNTLHTLNDTGSRIWELCDGQRTIEDIAKVIHEGSWEKTIEGIRRLREEEIPVKIKCAVMQQNVEKYREVYALALDLGAGYAFDPVITARDDGNKDTIKYRISRQDLQGIFEDPLFKGDPKEEGIEGIENFSCLISEVYEGVPCSAGHNICCISPEGDVTPCVQLPISCGNLRVHDFDWIWYTRMINSLFEGRTWKGKLTLLIG